MLAEKSKQPSKNACVCKTKLKHYRLKAQHMFADGKHIFVSPIFNNPHPSLARLKMGLSLAVRWSILGGISRGFVTSSNLHLQVLHQICIIFKFVCPLYELSVTNHSLLFCRHRSFVIPGPKGFACAAHKSCTTHACPRRAGACSACSLLVNWKSQILKEIPCLKNGCHTRCPLLNSIHHLSLAVFSRSLAICAAMKSTKLDPSSNACIKMGFVFHSLSALAPKISAISWHLFLQGTSLGLLGGTQVNPTAEPSLLMMAAA